MRNSLSLEIKSVSWRLPSKLEQWLLWLQQLIQRSVFYLTIHPVHVHVSVATGEFAVVVKTDAHTKSMYSTYFQEVEALKKENKEMKKDIKKMLKKLEKVEEKAKSADVGK